MSIATPATSARPSRLGHQELVGVADRLVGDVLGRVGQPPVVFPFTDDAPMTVCTGADYTWGSLQSKTGRHVTLEVRVHSSAAYIVLFWGESRVANWTIYQSASAALQVVRGLEAPWANVPAEEPAGSGRALRLDDSVADGLPGNNPALMSAAVDMAAAVLCYLGN